MDPVEIKSGRNFGEAQHSLAFDARELRSFEHVPSGVRCEAEVFSGLTSISTSNDRCDWSDTSWHLRNLFGLDDTGRASETVP